MFEVILANKTVYSFSKKIEMDAFWHKIQFDNSEKSRNNHEMEDRKHFMTFVSRIAFFVVLVPFFCFLLNKFFRFIMHKIAFLYNNDSLTSNLYLIYSYKIKFLEMQFEY